jgi:hypothetical protein
MFDTTGNQLTQEVPMNIQETKQVATGLVQTYVGPDSRVMDLPSFYDALVAALQAAFARGWKDRAEAERLTRH